MSQGYSDNLQLEAMAEQAKNRQAKDAAVRDKNTGEAGVSPKPVAQKITTDDLHALISRTEYTRLEGTTKTFCHIFIGDSGFSVTGESACLNPADFDEAVGRDFAFKDAFNKLWPLEGYHRMRVADEKAKWLAGVEQDARSTFGDIHADCTDRAAGQCVAASATVQPHQQRVIDEKAALDEKAAALSSFIGLNPAFLTLDAAEQERMKVQNDLMWQLSEVLGQRINAFGGSAAPEFRTSTKDSGC